MLRRIARAEEGSVSIEAALVVSFVLLPVLLGLWDVAQIGFGQAQVQEALQDAVTYVAAGNSSNSSGIAAAARAAYGSFHRRVDEHGLLLRSDRQQQPDSANQRGMQRQLQQQQRSRAVHEHHGEQDHYRAFHRALSRLLRDRNLHRTGTHRLTWSGGSCI